LWNAAWLDLASGFWQVELDPEKTAFITGIVSLSLRSCPSLSPMFRQLMDKVFQGLLWKITVIYLDDIIVFSPTFEKRLKDLEIVIEQLK